MADTVTEGFLTRINSRVDSIEGQAKHSEWVQKHTSIEGRPFSFQDHEMQQEIFDDPASRIAVKKCSQIGLSELQVRKLLTIAAVARYVRVIYTLPTRQFAMRFSKDRIDSTIAQSETLSGMLKRGADAAEQKIFTNSNVIYVTGTFGDVSAISVPATYVVNDELDFSNLEVIGKMSSRLRHAPMNKDGYRGYHYKFSTPTLPNFGVAEAFESGSQAYYMVQCEKCNHHQAPSWYKDFVIPGWDNPLDELDGQVVRMLMDRGLHQNAYLKCEKCGHDLQNSLLDPAKRQWVRKHPDRVESSYQISPWDVPTYNTPKSILTQFPEYARTMDFYNFVLGLEYEDADSVFITENFRTQVQAQWKAYIEDQIEVGALMRIIFSNAVAGMDVGKICHFTVAIPQGKSMHIVYAEEIHHTQAKPAKNKIMARIAYFGVRTFCMDAGPDITLVRELTSWGWMNGVNAYAVEYVKKVGLKTYELPDDPAAEPVAKVNRTNMFSDLMKLHNTGYIQYPRRDAAPIMDVFKEQVTNVKKISREDGTGDMIEVIVKTGPDHFGHSLNYTYLAFLIASEGGRSHVVGALPGVSGVKMRDSDFDEDAERLRDPLAGYRR
jgi:hypothetical protein